MERRLHVGNSLDRRSNVHRRSAFPLDRGQNDAADTPRKKSHLSESQNAQSVNLSGAEKPEGAKKKKVISSSAHCVNSGSFAGSVSTEPSSDNGRRPKFKSRHRSRHAVENHPSDPHAHPRAIGKRERSKSRDSSHRQSGKHSAPDSIQPVKEVDTQDTQGEYAEPIGAAEFMRVKKELEALRKEGSENKKIIKRYSKIIDELRKEAEFRNKTLKETEYQVQKWKNKSKKSDDIINNVELNVQCQICMELLLRPYVLSPCGHTLCLFCLQEWFRKAPPDADEMYDDDDPDYLVYRRKSCPCCRTAVISRPIPAFAVKSIASVLFKAKEASSEGPSHRASPPLDGDPWEGLFPADDDESDHFERSDADEDTEGDMDWLMDVFSYGSDSEDESYDGDYVLPRWEPPNMEFNPDDYPFEDFGDEDLRLLRRGVSMGMLHTYPIRYRHSEGIVIWVEENRLFPGWNISLSGDDDTGEVYVNWLLDDMAERPGRWEIEDKPDGTWDAHLLVAEDEVFDHSDTDTENYVE